MLVLSPNTPFGYALRSSRSVVHETTCVCNAPTRVPTWSQSVVPLPHFFCERASRHTRANFVFPRVVSDLSSLLRDILVPLLCPRSKLLFTNLSQRVSPHHLHHIKSFVPGELCDKPWLWVVDFLKLDRFLAHRCCYTILPRLRKN